MADIQTIVMPKWGLAMQEGMVAAWHVNVGDTLTKGQEIMDIETSKIANVFESPAAGKLRRRLLDAGEKVPVGALMRVDRRRRRPERRDRRLRRRVPGAVQEAARRHGDRQGPRPETASSAAAACATSGWAMPPACRWSSLRAMAAFSTTEPLQPARPGREAHQPTASICRATAAPARSGDGTGSSSAATARFVKALSADRPSWSATPWGRLALLWP